MNRKEAVKKLSDIIDYYWIEIEEKGLDNEITKIIEALEKEITLAEFLGWEENVEYKCHDDKFIIMDDELYIWNHTKRDWIDAYGVSMNRFGQLRQAKKIEVGE